MAEIFNHNELQVIDNDEAFVNLLTADLERAKDCIILDNECFLNGIVMLAPVNVQQKFVQLDRKHVFIAILLAFYFTEQLGQYFINGMACICVEAHRQFIHAGEFQTDDL